MKLKIRLLILIISTVILNAAPQIIEPNVNSKSSFAIIIDNVSFEKTKNALLAYRDAVEADGLATFVLVDEWQNPEAVKDAIVKLYNQEKCLEGVVFVGDIPIPMVRDAQHLTTAFKINQKHKMRRSSVPTDRFYDDFDLKFNFIEQDTVDTKLFYYSLTSDSPQIIKKEIYSARMKTGIPGEERFEVLVNYLFRIAKQKAELHKLDNAMVFSGHGYHSESLTAWADEQMALQEQFPELFQPGGKLAYLNHVFDDKMKRILLAELTNSDLDLAIFHAHGGDDAQYLNGYPIVESIHDVKEFLMRHVRSKMRSAERWGKTPDDYQDYYQDMFDIPDSWFENVFDDSVTVADSILFAGLDFTAAEAGKYALQPKFVMFDECFNGAFIETPYQAASYVFGDGNVIVAVGNSVNVKQDIWADEYLGLLNQGVRTGNWHKMLNTMESHLIGDPTFHFNETSNLSLKIASAGTSLSYWKKLLKSEQAPLRCIAIRKLYDTLGETMDEKLVKIYRNDASFVVRLEALKCLAASRSESFENILMESINDPYELTRRFTVMWMGKIGKKEYISYITRALLHEESERVRFAAKTAVEQYADRRDEIKNSFMKYYDRLPNSNDYEVEKKLFEYRINKDYSDFNNEIITSLTIDTLLFKTRRNAISSMRNINIHGAVPAMVQLAENENDDERIRVLVIETMGWFTFSKNRDQLIASCDRVINNINNPQAVRDEALKTKNRLITGSNYVIVP